MDVPEEAAQARDPELVTLSYDGVRLRLLRRDDGPWFVLEDLCPILALRSPRSVARRLHPDETTTLTILGERSLITAECANESGLYGAVMLSKGPEAPYFLRWAVGTAMPLLRSRRPTENRAAVREAVVEATAEMADQTAELHGHIRQLVAMVERNMSRTDETMDELRGLVGMVLPETQETVASLVARIEGMRQGHVALPATALSYCHVDDVPLAVLFRPDLFEGASDEIARTAGAAKAREDGLPLIVLIPEADDDRRASWDFWAKTTPGATVRYGRSDDLPMGVGRYRTVAA